MHLGRPTGPVVCYYGDDPSPIPTAEVIIAMRPNIARRVAPLLLAASLIVACAEAGGDTPPVLIAVITPSPAPPTASRAVVSPVTAAATRAASPTVAPTATSSPTVTPTAMPTATATPSATASPAPTASPTTTPDPYAGLSIADLAARPYGGGSVRAEKVLAVTDAFTRTLISYPSDGLTIYGFMNTPQGGNGPFPVVIASHGYIEPSQYTTLDYTTRYADALARAGFLVLHPNLRGYAPSDDGPNRFRVGMAARRAQPGGAGA